MKIYFLLLSEIILLRLQIQLLAAVDVYNIKKGSAGESKGVGREFSSLSRLNLSGPPAPACSEAHLYLSLCVRGLIVWTHQS